MKADKTSEAQRLVSEAINFEALKKLVLIEDVELRKEACDLFFNIGGTVLRQSFGTLMFYLDKLQEKHDVIAWLSTRDFNAAVELKRMSTRLNIPLEHLDIIIKTEDGFINRASLKIGGRGIEWHYLSDDGDFVSCNPPVAFVIMPSFVLKLKENNQAASISLQ